MRISSHDDLVERPFETCLGGQGGDTEVVLAIERSSGRAAWDRERFAHVLGCRQVSCHVITSRDALELPIAFFVVLRQSDTLYVANVAVMPSWRRLGVGSFAMERIEELALQEHCRRILLDVSEDNLAAQLLYRKMGFRAFDIRRQGDDGMDVYRMKKEYGGMPGLIR